MIDRFIWVAAYRLEEARQESADRHQYLRQGFACLALYVLTGRA